MRLVKLARTFLFAFVLPSVLLAACAPSAPAAAPTQVTVSTPTPAGDLVTQASQIVSIWQTFNPHCDPGFMLIRPDGTYTWSCSQDGSDGASGKYSLQNGRFLIQNDFCEGGQYEARLVSQPKSLVFTLIKDDCSTNVDALTKQPLVWVSGLAQAPTATKTAGELVTQADKITGIWQVFSADCQKGFMVIRPDGTYTWSCKQDGSTGASGKYWFEKGHFLIKSDYCDAPGQYEARVIQEDGQPKNLVFAVIKDDCLADLNVLTKQPAVWVGALP
jgi:hypothetical protein